MIRLPRQERRRADNVLPMINVAFLMLIFFLMVVVIAPPDPLDVALPEAATETGDPGEIVISMDADGQSVRGSVTGDAVFAGLVGRSVTLRADAGLAATDLAEFLDRLAASGAADARLVVVAR